MWESLLSAGLWQGEIWNRRKDGEVYPQWLIITAIKDNQQKTTNYVGVFHDMTEIKLHEEQLRYQAHHDALTGLPNRLLFKDRLGVAMSHAHRFDLKVGVLFLDLDDFKRINDSLGHTVGDYLLQDVAKRLERCLREDDTVARYGGDEFIVLLNELAYEEDAILAAQRILKAISPAICIQNQEFYLTVSMGIAFYPKDGLDQEILIRNADTAMYRAKEAGKNTYQVFTSAMSKKASEWFAVENSLRKALERQEFFLHYQPKIDVVSGRIAGVEALIRWRHENGEVISPNDFIPLAEDTGLIVEIGEWVLQQACTDVKKLWDKGHPISVSVNISPRQFRQENLPGKVAQVLEKTGLPAEALLLEITEGTVMENEEKSLVLLNTLRDMGVGLSIDDFGTGYSSLYYLKQLPIRELKIDRKFVRDIPKDEDDMAITSAIISMAKSLKLRVVAEGVETDEQMKVLRRRRCDHIQGFLFSRPISEEALHELLDSGKLFDSRQQKGRNQISLPF
jgi:diguanylate cyclase (GGDEF)-like protein